MAEAQGSGGETRYKIGDVCRLADVQPYVLRYWESEFPSLAPDRSVPGPRTYSERELRLIEQIKRLLYDEGYTIAGAKKRLEGEGPGPSKAAAPPAAAPAAEAKPPKAEKVEKPEPPAAPPAEKPKAPRPPKPERKAAEDTSPVDKLPATTAPIPVAAKPPAAADDGRVARAVAELKDVLALLNRETP